jgi:succinoglycan biosynthesis transport protein ExoP
MGISQFFRLLWARRMITVVSTVCCIIGMYLAVLILPERWEAHSRIMLNTIKPDPVTGEVIGAAARAYVSTQIELITDYSVAGRVVDDLKWLSDPTLIHAYQSRPGSDQRDFRHWAAQLVIDNTKVKLIKDSNILDIIYAGTSPAQAKTVADALSHAYVQENLAFRTEDASRNADWYSQQADKSKQQLDAAEAKKGDFERENHILLNDNRTDVDSVRLQALAMTSASTGALAAAGPVAPSAASIELAQIDAAIAQDAKTLGPNHPEAELVSREEANSNRLSKGVAASAATAGVGALDRAVEAQKQRVIAERGKVEQLKQLQDDVDRRREEYNRSAARSAALRQEGSTLETGLTMLGSAITPKSAAFPNYLLLIPGAIVLGLAIGVLVSLLAELLNRRVRGVEELEADFGGPVLSVIPSAMPKTKQVGFGAQFVRLPQNRKVIRA